MPLEANLFIESDSGKEWCPPGTSPGQAQQARGDRLRKEQSDADLRQHDNRGRCGVLPAEGVESNGVRTRGMPPPPVSF